MYNGYIIGAINHDHSPVTITRDYIITVTNHDLWIETWSRTVLVVISVPVHPLVNDTVTTDGRRNNATGNFGPPRTAQNDCSLSTSDLRALSASWLR